MKNDSFERIAIISIGVLIVFLVSKLIKSGLNNKVANTQNKYKARKAVNFFGYLFIVAIVIFTYSDKLGNVGTAIGVAGAGIAFALQEVIVSFAGWLNIIISNQVAVGNRVKIGEVKGDIIDIGVLTTTIMEIGDWVEGDLYNGRIVTLSNNFIFKEKVHNYSAEYPFLWDEITIPIRTESDYHLAKKVFSDVLIEICGEYADKSAASWKGLSNKY